MAAADVYDAIPKVELHCHVEGTVRPSTVVELARKNGRPLRSEDPTELYRYTSLNSFLAIFWLVQELLADRDDWARAAYESIVDGSPHGLRYREMFFTPARHLASGQDLAEIVAGLAEGIERAELETKARCMLICDIDRAYGGVAGLELVQRLAELRRAGRAERVIGLGKDYRSVARALEMPWSEMEDVALDGIEATWLDEEAKRALRAQFEHELDAIRPADPAQVA